MTTKACRKSGRKHTPIDLAYLAGLIDGEGSVIVNPYCPREGQRFKQYNLRVLVVNTNKEILEWIKSIFGGGVYSHGKPESIKHKQCYTWNIDAKKAEILLREVFPYLKIKKPQAKVALEFRKTFNLSKYIRYENGIHVGNKVPDNLLNKRSQLREELKSLNQRGLKIYDYQGV